VCNPDPVADVDPTVVALSSTQARVLGGLIEKQLTTPDAYPLTLSSLTSACNQTSNREPVVRFESQQVETAVLALKSQGLARIVHPGAGERATKYRQVAEEALGLEPEELALVCVLLLRGAQTAAELRSRTERLHGFGSGSDVEAALDRLARREPPLVARVERQPGQKEGRWLQLLEVGAEERAAAAPAAASVAASTRGSGKVEELEERVAALEAKVAALVEALGD
jgi:uncharacterized protein YceH (UPF0502 family)